MKKSMYLTDFESILVEKKHHHAVVRLNRPAVRNSFHPKMIAEITEAFKKLNQLKDIRCIVLRGEGKTFCSGADLNWMQEMVKYNLEKNKKDSAKLYEMFAAVRSSSVPVIAAVHGGMYGGALGFLACADLVIADQESTFCFSEVKLGIAPAVISEFILEKVSLAQVQPFMLSAEAFDVTRAIQMGLVHFKATAAEFEKVVIEKIKLFNDSGPEAVAATKKLLQKVNANKNQKLLVTKVISERRVSKEGQDGIKSFLQKRNPSWKMI